jgi:CheY-like chemotaxis protein
MTRVLLVDDNVDSAEITAEMLRAKGLEVSVANGALAALELMSTFLPEVALLDIGLPELDGYELARRITQSGVACRLIAVTGYGSERDRMRALEAGFAAHLLKPVTLAAMLVAIADGERVSGDPEQAR